VKTTELFLCLLLRNIKMYCRFCNFLKRKQFSLHVFFDMLMFMRNVLRCCNYFGSFHLEKMSCGHLDIDDTTMIQSVCYFL
jgi:hypothetical protein